MNSLRNKEPLHIVDVMRKIGNDDFCVQFFHRGICRVATWFLRMAPRNNLLALWVSRLLVYAPVLKESSRVKALYDAL
jgi:hypothetical protein